MENSKNTALLPGGVTQEQFDQWVKDFGKPNENIFRAKVKSLRNDTKQLYFYFKKPKKAVVALAMSHLANKELLKANDEFRNNCLLHAEPELLTDELHKDEYAQTIGKTIGDQFKFEEAEVEKI